MKPSWCRAPVFTGDLGYELWVQPGSALALWDALYAAGEPYGIQPYGEAATNMARLEAGFIMPAMEFNEALKTVHFEHDQTPFELGLGWLVDFRKPHFSGRGALLREKERGPKYRLVRLDIEGNRPAEGSYIYRDRRCTKEIGYVTSAMWSPARESEHRAGDDRTALPPGGAVGRDLLRKGTAPLQPGGEVHDTRQTVLGPGPRPRHTRPRFLELGHLPFGIGVHSDLGHLPDRAR